MDAVALLWLIPLGAATGFAAGLLGIGGGMLLVPFLSMLLPLQGVPGAQVVKVAIATSLTTILFTSLSSVRGHHRKGAVRWDVVRRLAPGIVVGSAAGAQVAGLIPGSALALLFAAFVALMATQMLSGRQASAADAGGDEGEALPGAGAMLGVGGLIGAISALVGAGGGFLTVPFLSSRRMTMQRAVGTSAACGFPIALAGSLGYVVSGWNSDLGPGMAGYVHLPALLVISAASMTTAQFGVKAAHALATASLRRLFAILLYGLAGYMLWRGLAPGG